MTASTAPRPLTTSGTPSRAVALLAMRAQGQREGNYDSDRFQIRTLRYSLRRVSPLDSVNCGTHNPTITARRLAQEIMKYSRPGVTEPSSPIERTAILSRT
jgi:predicted component of type VI protein secretion system